MAVDLTKRQAVSLVKKYAKAEPDRKAACRYVTADYVTTGSEVVRRPECIVGQMLVNDLGINVEDERLRTSQSAGQVLDMFGIKATKAAAQILDNVQALQDGRGISHPDAIEGEIASDTWRKIHTWAEAAKVVLG